MSPAAAQDGWATAAAPADDEREGGEQGGGDEQQEGEGQAHPSGISVEQSFRRTTASVLRLIHDIRGACERDEAAVNARCAAHAARARALHETISEINIFFAKEALVRTNPLSTDHLSAPDIRNNIQN